jgi:NTP pyrophosphatase (non-canonical NTP hydrolase)
MNAQEYVKKVLITENRDLATLAPRFSSLRGIRLLHGGIGLSSELAEAQEMAEKPFIDAVNLKEEMGDLYWYMGIIVDELKFNPEEIFRNNEVSALVAYGSQDQKMYLQYNVNGMVKSVGVLMDFLKKGVIYGKDLNENGVKEKLQELDYYINQALRYYGQTSQGARERNIEKLSARYGEKFSEAAALERNLAAEREILEKQ